ncbi:MAG: heavy metal translocating P-type ATPase [Mycoplasmatales bacterium]
MKRAKYKVAGISCTNCASTIKNGFSKKYSDVVCDVNVTTSEVYLQFDEQKYSENNLKKTLKEIGYPIVENEMGNQNKLIIAIFLTLILNVGMLTHFEIFAFIPDIFANQYLQLVIATIVQFYIGFVFYKSAYHSAKQKVLGMDFLIVLGSTAAYLYSVIVIVESNLSQMPLHYPLFFEVGATVITVVLIGKLLEEKAKAKSNDYLDSMLKYVELNANLVLGEKELEIPVEQLKLKDKIVVYPNQKVPVDARIIEGETHVNDSVFTGESKPAKKQIGDVIIGGSINLDSIIYLEVEKIGSETMISQMIRTLEEASLSKTKIQLLADKIASIFVPAIIVIAILAFIFNIYYLDQALTVALTRALTVILISCPCALGLATPVSIITASGLAAKNALLYKGGDFFEQAPKLTMIAFDKTGTLTNGEPTVEYFNLKEEDVPYLYALEKTSTHPLSRAVINYLENEYKHVVTAVPLKVEDLTVHKGKGLMALVNEKQVLVGNLELFIQEQIVIDQIKDNYSKLVNDIMSVNIIAIDGEVVGIYGITDQLKTTAKPVIAELKKMGLKVVMITGDNEVVGKNVQEKLGIDVVHAKVLPLEKAKIIEEYIATGELVGFVGDGVNDAVALQTATVGISFKQGSDLAIKYSDLILLKPDLNLLIKAIKLSKATLKNIQENFFWAFAYNFIAIPLAFFGKIDMLVAAIAMGFSSIVVVLNALRLKKTKM